MSEKQPTVTSDSDGYMHTFYGILNHLGQFWTPMPFETEKAARDHIAAWKRHSPNLGLSRHRIVPVRVRLELINQRTANTQSKILTGLREAADVARGDDQPTRVHVKPTAPPTPMSDAEAVLRLKVMLAFSGKQMGHAKDDRIRSQVLVHEADIAALTLAITRLTQPSVNVELLAGARPFAIEYEPWMDEHDDGVQAPMRRVTFGQVRALRSAIQSAEGGRDE